MIKLTETQKAMNKYLELLELIPEDGTALKDMLGEAIIDFGNIRYMRASTLAQGHTRMSAETHHAEDIARELIEDAVPAEDFENIWNRVYFYASMRYEDGKERGWNDGFEDGRASALGEQGAEG